MPPPIPPKLPPVSPVRVIAIPEQPSPARGLWIGAICIAAMVIGGSGIAFWSIHRAHLLPPREMVSAADKHKATRDAFVGSDVKVGDADGIAISAALDALNAATIGRDPSRVAAAFDIDRLCDELVGMGALKAISAADRPAFEAGCAGGLTQGLTALHWSHHQVKKIVMSADGNEAVVYDLETNGVPPAKHSVKMRLWLHRSSGQWRVWDFESLEQGCRASTIIAAGFDSTGSIRTSATSTVPIIASLRADLTAKNWPMMETDLKQFDAISLPPEFASIRLTFWGLLHLKQKKYEQTLKDCDAIDAAGQDVPIVNQFRAESYLYLGQYENALKSCQSWEDALGGDSNLYYVRGMALVHLKRLDEAQDSFGKSLDEDVDAAGSLAELSKILPVEKKSEIARRFSLAETPHVVFFNSMSILERAWDVAGMQTIIDAFVARPESAGDPWVPYYRAELNIHRKHYAEAEAQLRPLVPEAWKKGQAMFASEYYYSATLANDAMGAYQSASDQKTAFRELARRLYSTGKYRNLADLCAEHLNNFSDDPMPYFYQGCVHEAARDYPAAETAYARAMSLANGTEVEQIRARRVYARFAAGNGLSAYHDVPPKDKTFLQLAKLFSAYRQEDLLAKLIELRRSDNPNDPELTIYEAQSKFLHGDYTGTLDLLAGIRSNNNADSARWNDLYFRSQIRLKNFDAARAEADRVGVAKAWHTALIECAAGNVGEATRALDEVQKQDEIALENLYADPDIGAALATAPFADWRAKHPRPVARPATTPTTKPAELP